MSDLEDLKKNFETEAEKMRQLEKDRSKCVTNRRQLESQLTENNMVKDELNRLPLEANVFKSIGPVLVKQDLTEAKENVQKRIEYITTEIVRVEAAIVDFAQKIENQKLVLEKARDMLKDALGAPPMNFISTPATA